MLDCRHEMDNMEAALKRIQQEVKRRIKGGRLPLLLIWALHRWPPDSSEGRLNRLKCPEAGQHLMSANSKHCVFFFIFYSLHHIGCVKQTRLEIEAANIHYFWLFREQLMQDRILHRCFKTECNWWTLHQAATTSNKLHQLHLQYSNLFQNSQLLIDARAARAYRDEVDALRERAFRADKLESEAGRYREQLHKMEFYKAKVEVGVVCFSKWFDAFDKIRRLFSRKI